jgi:formamidopyrimidine-DNA glycosylase
MPELPEVETIRRRLLACLPGLVIRDVVVNDETVSAQSGAELRAILAGRRILDVRRRGKYLLVDVGGAVAVIHLRMTGQLLFAGPETSTRSSSTLSSGAGPVGTPARAGEAGLGVQPLRQPRFVWRLEPRAELQFRDVRRFGRLWAFESAGEEGFFAGMGPEPLGPLFTVDYLREAMRGRAAPLKSFLLDQRRIAGVGNIYADEALFRARLHPLRAAGSVGPREAARLHAALLETLQAGIDHAGSSVDTFVDPGGQRGSFQDILNVYRRTGAPCRVCGTAIRRVVVGGRGSHFCPRCQPRRGGMMRPASGRPARISSSQALLDPPPRRDRGH